MLQLNLPHYKFKIKKEEEKQLIFDLLRKKYVKLTPEEWVRQNFIQFLLTEKSYPAALIAIEKELKINGMKKRCDAVVYNIDAEPIMIIEFKAPEVNINQKVFDQVAVYNTKLKVEYLIVSNGLQHHACRINLEDAKYEFFMDVPTYSELMKYE
jgi:type I site-specific restriction-modification system R (restriction) subunit